MKIVTSILLVSMLMLLAVGATAADYDIHYEVKVHPDNGTARVEVKLKGKKLPSQLAIHFDKDRHSNFESNQALEVAGELAIWHPQKPVSTLSYQVVINHRKGKDSYDSLITDSWAVLRSDMLIPPISVTAIKGLQSSAVLDLNLPDGWSSATPYENVGSRSNRFLLRDPGRQFIRPKGWLILGEITTRLDTIAGTDVIIAAPRGQNARLQDALAFLNWTLPPLKAIFPDFPSRLLIVSADDPMWRGGLSAPNSLFMHNDRPLISGNRTSSLIHELVHVGTSIHGMASSDAIVEGIAEYYALEILRRSGGISDFRFTEAIEKLAIWGKEADSLLTDNASGATTARAVGMMYAVDQEIQKLTNKQSSLDDVATLLAAGSGKVTVKGFIQLAEETAGKSLRSLDGLKKAIKK